MHREKAEVNKNARIIVKKKAQKFKGSKGVPGWGSSAVPFELKIFGSKPEIPTTQYTINQSNRLGDKIRLTLLAIWASFIARIFLANDKKGKDWRITKKTSRRQHI